jgi:hypothetical protein
VLITTDVMVAEKTDKTASPMLTAAWLKRISLN